VPRRPISKVVAKGFNLLYFSDILPLCHGGLHYF